MFFTVEHRRQYGRIFHLLMRLKLARLVAQSGAFRWLMSRRLGGGGTGMGGARQFAVFRADAFLPARWVVLWRRFLASIKRSEMPTALALFHFRVQRFLHAIQVSGGAGR